MWGLGRAQTLGKNWEEEKNARRKKWEAVRSVSEENVCRQIARCDGRSK